MSRKEKNMIYMVLMEQNYHQVQVQQDIITMMLMICLKASLARTDLIILPIVHFLMLI
jgi:hypothetical protein